MPRSAPNRIAPRPAAVTGRNSRPLRVGFVPLCDSAPLVVAQEHGFFRRHGLAVELRRELGWAAIREQVVHGRLEAAHALAAMPFAATLGLGTFACPSLTALILNHQGNAITLAHPLALEGVEDARSFGDWVRRTRPAAPPVFGVVSMVSSHRYLLRLWLEQAGLAEGRDVHLVVVPPPQMPAHLKTGTLAGYCAGEPWNSVAIEAGLGWCVATSADLAPGRPEKVLMVREGFAEERAEEHLRLVAALAQACEFCADPTQHDGLAQLLAGRAYVNAPAGLIRRSFGCGFKDRPKSLARPERFTIYAGNDANVPTPELGHWVLRHLLPAEATRHLSHAAAAALVARVFRGSVFVEAVKAAADRPVPEAGAVAGFRPMTGAGASRPALTPAVAPL